MPNYPMFYEHSVPSNIGELEEIADRFSIYITDEDIWNIVRCYEKPPHLGNIYMDILFSRLENTLKEEYPELDIDYYINGIDSHFYINQEKVYSLEQFNQLTVFNEDLQIGSHT